VNIMASPFYNALALQTLTDVISPPRIASYVAETGDLQSAVDLYVWNVRASATLYGPLSILEVALRNALHRELKSMFGPSWHDDPSFNAAVATVAETTPRNAPCPRRALSKPTDVRPAINDAKQRSGPRDHQPLTVVSCSQRRCRPRPKCVYWCCASPMRSSTLRWLRK